MDSNYKSFFNTILGIMIVIENSHNEELSFSIPNDYSSLTQELEGSFVQLSDRAIDLCKIHIPEHQYGFGVLFASKLEGSGNINIRFMSKTGKEIDVIFEMDENNILIQRYIQ